MVAELFRGWCFLSDYYRALWRRQDIFIKAIRALSKLLDIDLHIWLIIGDEITFLVIDGQLCLHFWPVVLCLEDWAPIRIILERCLECSVDIVSLSQFSGSDLIAHTTLIVMIVIDCLSRAFLANRTPLVRWWFIGAVCHCLNSGKVLWSDDRVLCLHSGTVLLDGALWLHQVVGMLWLLLKSVVVVFNAWRVK